MRFGTSMWFGASVLAGACIAAAACSSSNADLAPAADAGGTSDTGSQGDTGASGDAGGMACGTTTSTTVMTPFAAPNDQLTFTTPTIPCNMFNITNYGAKSDGTTKNTSAFAQAVAAAKAMGGGVVEVPAGTWLTGPIHLDNNIELHLEAGAIVQFSTDFADYGPPTTPLVLTRWEGLDIYNFSPLVYCLNCTNVAITGSGKLFGQGAYWWDWKASSPTEDQKMYNAILMNITMNGVTFVNGVPTMSDGGAPKDAGAPEGGAPAAGPLCGVLTPPSSGVVKGLRPTMVECNGCKNFLIQGVTIEDGPYWTVHPVYSENVIIRDAHIQSGKEAPIAGGGMPSNGDGIDVDSCKKVLIERTDFDTSDDNIAVKSGLNEDGICVNRPSEEVVVRGITSIAGHGGMTVGSEMSGGVTNVYATSSTMTGTGVQYPLRFKTLAGRGGTVSNIFFENITIGNWTTGAIILDMSYPSSTLPPADQTLLPTVTNVNFKNISGPNNTPGASMCPTSATSCPPVTFKGIKQSPLQKISLTNVSLDGMGSVCLSGPGAVTLTNVNIPGLMMNGTWDCP